MRNVLVGAGVAVLLGLVTGMVGWKWANIIHRKSEFLKGNSSKKYLPTLPPPTEDQSNVNESDKTVSNRSFNFTRPFNVSSRDVSGVTSVSSVTSLITGSPIDFSGDNSSTEHLTTDFFNESTAINSSLLQESNFTEVSLGLENLSQNSSLLTNSTEDDIDYAKMGQELLTKATRILDTGIWDLEKRTEDGDAIFSRQLDNGNMVYRLTGIVDMPPQDLLVIIWDGLADYPKWNPTLLECRVLEKINDQTDISYTVSAPGARGYVASRDFVSLRHWELRHNAYIAASKSIDFPGAPSNVDYVRGKNGPGCMELRPLSSDPSKTEFRWLLNTKLNGWIPSYIADKAYKKFMTKYMIFLREYCKKIKQRATDFTVSSTTPKNITE